jgi:hypothetical protein
VTLRHNQRMRALTRSLGFRQSMEEGDPSLVRMVVELGEPAS